MLLDYNSYDELSDSVDQLLELSFLFRLFSDCDTVFTKENFGVSLGVLYSFSDSISQISATLDLIRDRFVCQADEKEAG